MIHVVRSGALTTVQDLGRPGYAHLGVPSCGALDAPALRRANRLVGNPDGAAALETTLTGCAIRLPDGGTVAVTGATAAVRVDRRPVDPGTAVTVPPGAVVDVGRARAGVRSYLAVAGGIAVEPVLGSRSTDTLSGLGPAPLRDDDTLPLGSPAPAAAVSPAPVGPAPVGPAPVGELTLALVPGPRDDWFTAEALATLLSARYTVSPVSNRIGVRLAGPALDRARTGELPSEGVVLGAVQVPTDGRPLVFLADHPTTGGYPVVGVVPDVTPLAQARPGTTLRFTTWREP